MDMKDSIAADVNMRSLGGRLAYSLYTFFGAKSKATADAVKAANDAASNHILNYIYQLFLKGLKKFGSLFPSLQIPYFFEFLKFFLTNFGTIFIAFLVICLIKFIKPIF